MVHRNRGLTRSGAAVWACTALFAGCDNTDSSTGCKDLHQFQDNQRPENCWEPPFYYCANGGGGAITTACNADKSACCTFASTCVFCDWTVAAEGSVTLTPTAPECQPSRMPDQDAQICWDGLDPPPLPR